MARKVNFGYSRANLSLDEINQTYDNVLSAIDIKYSEDKNIEYTKCFFGYTIDEINKERESVCKEIEKEIILTLFASVEAILRADFINRCQLKRKDKLSMFYRKGYNASRRIYTYSLSEIVLKGWKEYLPIHENLINQVNESYKYRNWLAHGRYWQLEKSFSKYDYYTLYALLKAFIAAIEPYIVEE